VVVHAEPNGIDVICGVDLPAGGQSDILRLDALERRFDVIAAGKCRLWGISRA
jgi:hypothetical protein